MKEATDRTIGVIDADSNVISCSDTSLIGEKWPEAVIKLNSAPDSIVVVDKKTFKPLVSWSAYFDYAVFAEGEDETARTLCVMVGNELHNYTRAMAQGEAVQAPAEQRGRRPAGHVRLGQPFDGR